MPYQCTWLIGYDQCYVGLWRPHQLCLMRMCHIHLVIIIDEHLPKCGPTIIVRVEVEKWGLQHFCEDEYHFNSLNWEMEGEPWYNGKVVAL
jgi:hypothetical protein